MSLAKTGTMRQLKTFNTIARLGSVSLAAQELHITQSAASLQIASLERAVGSALLVRTGRGMRLTEAGELLNHHAGRVLGLWNDASEEMESFRGDFSGTLNIGSVSTVEYWLPHLLVTFLEGNPRAKVKLHVGNREEIVRSLAAHRIDVAIMGTPPEELKVVAGSFATNPMAFVAAPGHPLMERGLLSMADLARARLLVREAGSGSRTMVERIFREAGLQIGIGSELSSNESLKQMCVAGFGPAYMSMHICVLEMNAGLLRLLPMANNPILREWYVVRIASRTVPQIALAFDAFIRESGQRLITPLVQVGEASSTGRSAVSVAPDAVS